MNRGHISSGIMDRMRVFESKDSLSGLTQMKNRSELSALENGRTITQQQQQQQQQQHQQQHSHDPEQRAAEEEDKEIMMMSTPVPPPPPPGVQTDANGLILPKKLKNPCLESSDRKQLHRELKFNNKVGKSVLNQKTELQRAYEKQRERQQQQHLHQDHEQHSPTGGVGGLKGELTRVIMERAQKYERSLVEQPAESDDGAADDKQYVNPEYLNVRAKLRHGQRAELK